MKQLLRYFNPLAYIGKRNYSILFPFCASVILGLLSELYVYGVAKDPSAVGTYIIFINIASIIYLSFRDGIRGGVISVFVTVCYYAYIIYTRDMSGESRTAGLIATAMLGSVYLVIALVIGWLKQTIDKLVEREANERRRLQAIIQQLPVGVVITDEKGNVTLANKQIGEILGKSLHKNETINEDTIPNATYKGKPVKSNQWPLAQTLNTKKPVVGKEFVIYQKNGKKITAQISASVVKNTEGKVIAAASIINDISAQKEAERQKDEFIGIASHELKTPVTSIKAYTQVLKYNFEKTGDKKSAESLKKMDTQLNKLTDLIGDLLDVTKIESGQIQFNEDVFDFDSVVKEQINQLQMTTERHKLILKCKTKKKVFGDSERMGQVITNLVSNAIKYSPNANKIIIEGEVVGKNLQLCVQDFGIGMSKRSKDKVFERFYRVSGPNSTTFPGLGLGLYISFEIVRRMNGKIWVESEEGKGSTFCFSIPINQ